jgi:hypothetical protein
MVLPLTEQDGTMYTDYKVSVVKNYSLKDTCTIEHLFGMDIDEPNGEGCLDLACHECNTSRGTPGSEVIKPFGREGPTGSTLFESLKGVVK